jgi:hypothetical protein
MLLISNTLAGEMRSSLWRFAKLASPPGLGTPLFPSVAFDVPEGHPVSAI